MSAVTISERLRTARVYVGMSAADVAAGTGIGEDDLAGIEGGTRKVDELELQRLARLYGYSAAYFHGYEEPLPDDAVTILTRLTRELTEPDRQEALRFAAYLRQAPDE